MKNQVIELENGKKYAIAETIELDNKPYFYMINLENNKDIRFAEVNSDEINFVDDDLYDLLMFEVFKKQQN